MAVLCLGPLGRQRRPWSLGTGFYPLRSSVPSLMPTNQLFPHRRSRSPGGVKHSQPGPTLWEFQERSPALLGRRHDAPIYGHCSSVPLPNQGCSGRIIPRESPVNARTYVFPWKLRDTSSPSSATRAFSKMSTTSAKVAFSLSLRTTRRLGERQFSPEIGGIGKLLPRVAGSLRLQRLELEHHK